LRHLFAQPGRPEVTTEPLTRACFRQAVAEVAARARLLCPRSWVTVSRKPCRLCSQVMSS
jgi:hypothetical protein